MFKVHVALGGRSYDIYIEKGLLSRLGFLMRDVGFESKLMIVSNPTVWNLYGNTMMKSIMDAGFEPMYALVPDGEEHKNLAQAGALYDKAFSGGMDRRSAVVALGGGVIGDLAGFVAATYMRGVPFVQVPTTLLAQVDSSVGGKVAVNHPRGKNIIGSFYQPAAVFIDPLSLETLDIGELRAGLAEVIKYGIIEDADFFGWLEGNMERVLSLEEDAVSHVIASSCRSKARVVEEDETEQGKRAVLNFGHTVGHAVETLTSYRAYRHGEAVAVGMAAAGWMAVAAGMFSPGELRRLEVLIKRAGLPVKLNEYIPPEGIIEAMRMDKKAITGKLTFVLPVRIGRVEIVRDVGEEFIKKALKHITCPLN